MKKTHTHNIHMRTKSRIEIREEKIPSEITMESWSETENRFFEWDVRQNNEEKSVHSQAAHGTAYNTYFDTTFWQEKEREDFSLDWLFFPASCLKL